MRPLRTSIHCSRGGCYHQCQHDNPHPQHMPSDHDCTPSFELSVSKNSNGVGREGKGSCPHRRSKIISRRSCLGATRNPNRPAFATGQQEPSHRGRGNEPQSRESGVIQPFLRGKGRLCYFINKHPFFIAPEPRGDSGQKNI